MLDIDLIEIRSDDDAEESVGIKTRRVYHYRVSNLRKRVGYNIRVFPPKG